MSAGISKGAAPNRAACVAAAIFIRTERRTVRRCRALLVRRTETNDGLAANQCRAISVSSRLLDCCSDSRSIMTINICNHLPAVRFKALDGIVGKPGATSPSMEILLSS